MTELTETDIPCQHQLKGHQTEKMGPTTRDLIKTPEILKQDKKFQFNIFYKLNI